MNHPQYFVACIIYSTAIVVSAANGPAFGRVGELLLPGDLSTIARLAADPHLLAVEAEWEQILPEAWVAFAYLRPESARQGIRRGRIVSLRSSVTNKRAQAWRVTARAGRYAQVVLPGKSFPQYVGSADLDRPFKVLGRFSDEEIGALIAYVRSSPRKPPIPDAPDGTSYVEAPDQLDGHLPVVQLKRVDRNRVEVWIADNGNSGQHAELEHRNGAWHVRKISMHIA